MNDAPLDPIQRAFHVTWIVMVALFLVIVAAVVYLYVKSYSDRQSIKDTAIVAQATSDSQAELIQTICDTLSRSRIVSNRQLREPLRTALESQARVLLVAASSPANRGTARGAVYVEEAERLITMAARVKNVGKLDCVFEHPTKKKRE